MTYDIVMCMHPEHKDIAVKTIKSLHFFLGSRKIFVITSEEAFNNLKEKVENSVPLHFLDENELIDGFDLTEIKKIMFDELGTEGRANWYFQQFLKMAAAQHPEIEGHYLIWDSDTLLLRKIEFFDDAGNIFFNPIKNTSQSYFDLIRNALGIERQVEYSFINEHLMIRKDYMLELIDALEKRAPATMSWVRYLIHSMGKQTFSYLGFSEFETYGNFVAYHHKNIYKPRPLKTARAGAEFFGMNPNKYDYFRLMRNGYTLISFEFRHRSSGFKIIKEKIKSIVYYSACLMQEENEALRKNAFQITA